MVVLDILCPVQLGSLGHLDVPQTLYLLWTFVSAVPVCLEHGSSVLVYLDNLHREYGKVCLVSNGEENEPQGSPSLALPPCLLHMVPLSSSPSSDAHDARIVSHDECCIHLCQVIAPMPAICPKVSSRLLLQISLQPPSELRCSLLSR